jgi:glycosyltransferase involved in cell wall biosynthesis
MPGHGVSVLQVLARDLLGGTEHMVATLAERADRFQVRFEVALLDDPGPVAARVRAAGVPVLSLGGNLPRATGRLARVLARRRFEVVNAYGFKATMLTAMLARAVSPGTSFVSGVRSLHPAEGDDLAGTRARLVLAAERHAARLVDAYDANSLGALEVLAGLGIPRARLHHIPNGIDVAAWPEAAHAPTRHPTIVCAARLVARKRHRDLLDAAARLARAGTAFRLVCAGDGPLHRELERRATELELGDAVQFPGALRQAELRDLLAGADIACLVSSSEGMSNSVMEAMAGGLPVVGTRVNGIRELVVDGETGVLVAPGDPAAIADGLRALIGDRELRVRMGKAGRARAGRYFSLEAMVSAKQDLYRMLAAG